MAVFDGTQRLARRRAVLLKAVLVTCLIATANLHARSEDLAEFDRFSARVYDSEARLSLANRTTSLPNVNLAGRRFELSFAGYETTRIFLRARKATAPSEQRLAVVGRSPGPQRGAVRTGTLRITSSSNVLVILDGEMLNPRKSLTEYPVAIGEHWLQIALSGYHTVELSVYIRAGERTDVAPVLDVISNYGQLSVVTNPPGAETRLDDVPIGLTPIDQWRLEPGQHRLRITAKGYLPIDRKVTIAKGKTKLVSETLPRARSSVGTRAVSGTAGARTGEGLDPVLALMVVVSVGVISLAIAIAVLVRRRAHLATLARASKPVPPMPVQNITPHAVRGRTFGAYELFDELGRGGMGIVYRARNRDTDRPVALKVPFENMIHDREFIQRFLRQAEIGSQLSHPNIVRVVDSGEVAGTPYLAMELIEGQDLRRKIDSVGLLPISEAVDYTIQVCEALDYVHLKDIFHRDIKPENILLTDNGRVQVMDFGIALARQMPRISIDGVRWFSGAYMCLDENFGPTSDLYSLGIVLYEMLTGKPPFETQDLVSLIDMHKEMVPPSIQERRPEIPRDLELAIMRMLKKTPEERFPSAVHVIRALRPFSV